MRACCVWSVLVALLLCAAGVGGSAGASPSRLALPTTATLPILPTFKRAFNVMRKYEGVQGHCHRKVVWDVAAAAELLSEYRCAAVEFVCVGDNHSWLHLVL